MKDILEELYHGRVQPLEDSMPQSREYREARERAHIMGQEFLEKLDRLDPSLRCDYVKLTDAENDADHYEFYQNFVIGFRLATQIVMTIFTGK